MRLIYILSMCVSIHSSRTRFSCTFKNFWSRNKLFGFMTDTDTPEPQLWDAKLQFVDSKPEQRKLKPRSHLHSALFSHPFKRLFSCKVTFSLSKPHLRNDLMEGCKVAQLLPKSRSTRIKRHSQGMIPSFMLECCYCRCLVANLSAVCWRIRVMFYVLVNMKISRCLVPVGAPAMLVGCLQQAAINKKGLEFR